MPAGHPHALRHSFGTALAEAGVDLAVLQALMGHDHVDSSAAYIHLSPAHVRAPPTMLPATASAPADHGAGRRGEDLLGGYLAALAARGAGNRSFHGAARAFLARWPDPQAWAEQPLSVRLSAGSAVRPLLNHLMVTGLLRPGYDWLLERKLPALPREAAASPLTLDLDRFLSAATELGYTRKVAAGLASQVAVRLLIQTGRRLSELDDTDLAEFGAAITARERAHDRVLKHYCVALAATRGVLYHLDGNVAPTAKNTAHLRWPWRQHFTGVPTEWPIHWSPTWNARRVRAPVRPCSVWPVGSGTSPGSSPHTIPP